MFGPDYEVGACPGCSNLGDELDATRVHLNHRDVTLICFSRAPIDRLIAYKERMGWQFPYVSTYGTDFPFDFGLALTPEQAQEIPEVKQMIDDPPEWLQDWGRQVGAKLEDGLREGPSFIAFARENGTVYHTYTVTAPDPFVAPYHSFLLERTPKPEPEEPRAWRKDEYPAKSGTSGLRPCQAAPASADDARITSGTTDLRRSGLASRAWQTRAPARDDTGATDDRTRDRDATTHATEVGMSTTGATAETTPQGSSNLGYDVFVNEPPPQDGLLPNGEPKLFSPRPAR